MDKLKSYCHEFLNNLTTPVVFVDIGARNGILELEDIAKFIHAYGFEPNAEEYEKLIKKETDSAVRYGVGEPEFQKLTHLPYAISNVCGQQEFYITSGPGACGLLEPNWERLEEIIYKGGRYERSFREIFEIVEKPSVEVKTLDAFVSDTELDYIDYLKVDVEGSEYEVFEGASQILNRVGVIRTEVSFIPVRKNQRLFSDVDLQLRKYGFDLLNYEVSIPQIGYKERETPISIGPSVGFADRYGQPVNGDAVYVNRNLIDPERLIAQAVVLIQKRYLDEALFILKRKVKLEGQDAFFEYLRTYQGDTVRCFARRMLNVLRRGAELLSSK